MVELLKTKTFWAAVLSLLASFVLAAFGPDDKLVTFTTFIQSVLSDDKFWLGVVGITGRNALLNVAKQRDSK